MKARHFDGSLDRRRPKWLLEMNRYASLSPLGTEFDKFLFAPLGEDIDEMPLSVLSAFARLDVDPWEEAANLAQLPRSSATERLMLLIAALPDGSSARLDAGRASARLIALLPQRASSNPSREMLLGSGAATNPWAIIYLCVTLMAVAMAAQCIIASRQPPTKVDDARAGASITASPQEPTWNSGQ
jgi:hypothetical protein